MKDSSAKSSIGASSTMESVSSTAKEALQNFKFQKSEPVKDTEKESGQKSAFDRESSQESIEESIQESVEKCLKVSKRMDSIDDSDHNQGKYVFFLNY